MAKEFVKTNLAIQGVFLFIYYMVTFLEENARYFPKYQVTRWVMFEYFLSQLPKLIVDILPFSVLFSSAITLWSFSRSGEISAMRASGMSVVRVCRPLLVLGFFTAVGSFVLSEFVVPRSAFHLRYVAKVKIEKSLLDKIFLESNWVKGTDGILKFQSLDHVNKTLKKPEYFVFSGVSRITQIIHGERAYLDKTKGVWVMENVLVTHLDTTSGPLKTEVLPFYETSVISEPPRLLREEVPAEEVSYKDLRQVIRESERAGGDVLRREIDLYQKLSMPWASFLFVFLSLPFALRKERQADTYMGIVLIIFAAIIYWVGSAAIRGFAQQGHIPPLLAAWTMNAVFAVVGFGIVRRVDKGG
jgi:lipopolysaccharide export system permease protein